MRYALTAVALVLASSAWAQSLAPIDSESKYVPPTWADSSTAPHWGGTPMQYRGAGSSRSTAARAESPRTAPVPAAQSPSGYTPPTWADSSAAPHWGGTPMRYRARGGGISPAGSDL